MHCRKGVVRALELCESRGGHPGLPVPKCPDGLCGHKATLNLNWVVSSEFSAGRKAHRQLIGIAQDDMPALQSQTLQRCAATGLDNAPVLMLWKSVCKF